MIKCKFYNKSNKARFGRILDEIDNKYTIYTDDDEILEINKDLVCITTKLHDINGKLLFDKDFIRFDTDKGSVVLKIVFYTGNVEIYENISVYIDGLVFEDFTNKYSLIGDSCIENNMIKAVYISNEVENNFKK